MAPPAPVAAPPGPPLAPPHPAPDGGTRRRPWARIAVAAAAVVAVAVAGVLVIPPLVGKDGDKDGAGSPGAENGGGAGDGLKLTKSKVRLVITAPAVPPLSFLDQDICNGGKATRIDLENLSVANSQPDVPNTEVRPPATLKYMACHTDAGSDEDRPIMAELRFLDREAVAGLVDKPEATAEECRAAARVASLPESLPLAALNSSIVSPGMGFCVETSQKTVVLVWMTDIQEAKGGQGLRTFTTVATQWKPKSGKGS